MCSGASEPGLVGHFSRIMKTAEIYGAEVLDGYLFQLENIYFLAKTFVQIFSSKLCFLFFRNKFVSVLLPYSSLTSQVKHLSYLSGTYIQILLLPDSNQ